MSDQKSIYELGLHESAIVLITDADYGSTEAVTATRVPGGWLYRTPIAGLTIGFVPYSDEFKPKAAKRQFDTDGFEKLTREIKHD